MGAKTADTVDMVTVDVEVLREVYLDAQRAAKANGEDMATVGRQIMRDVIKRPDAKEIRELPPTERPRGAVKRPYRFEMPEDKYELAKMALHRHGKSVAGWIEHRLKHLARTGAL